MRTWRTDQIAMGMLAILGLMSLSVAARAQNWTIVIKDVASGTPTDQVNGRVGGTAVLSATVFNFTGTSLSDDGTGSPAPFTTLDFAGFGWTLNPGQTDLESLFTPAAGIPGFPSVPGSADGSVAGSSGIVTLGTFDLSGLAPGIYEEDYTAGAFPSDPDSTILFGDVTGTLRLDVLPPETAAAEPSSIILTASGVISLFGLRPRRRTLRLRRQWSSRTH